MTDHGLPYYVPIAPHYDIVLIDREDEPDDWRSGSNVDWMDELGPDEV